MLERSAEGFAESLTTYMLHLVKVGRCFFNRLGERSLFRVQDVVPDMYTGVTAWSTPTPAQATSELRKHRARPWTIIIIPFYDCFCSFRLSLAVSTYKQATRSLRG